jgi:hypothetical protein
MFMFSYDCASACGSGGSVASHKQVAAQVQVARHSKSSGRGTKFSLFMNIFLFLFYVNNLIMHLFFHIFYDN